MEHITYDGKLSPVIPRIPSATAYAEHPEYFTVNHNMSDDPERVDELLRTPDAELTLHKKEVDEYPETIFHRKIMQSDIDGSQSGVKTSDTQQKQIDKMTLELLVNKRQYRKYLEKCDSSEFALKTENHSRFCKYKREIGMLFRDLLNDYSISGSSVHLGNSDIQHIFEAFIQKSTSFFEAKEYEMRPFNARQSDIDGEDTLFPPSAFESPFDSYAGEMCEEDTTDLCDEPYSSENLFQGIADSIGNRKSAIFRKDEVSYENTSPFTNPYKYGNSFWGKNIVKRK